MVLWEIAIICCVKHAAGSHCRIFSVISYIITFAADNVKMNHSVRSDLDDPEATFLCKCLIEGAGGLPAV